MIAENVARRVGLHTIAVSGLWLRKTACGICVALKRVSMIQKYASY